MIFIIIANLDGTVHNLEENGNLQAHQSKREKERCKVLRQTAAPERSIAASR
jgi:hypothetical protein